MKISRLFFILLLSVILVAGGFLIFFKLSVPKPAISILSPTSALTAWKTHTDLQSGFEFKYPPNWQDNGNLTTDTGNTVVISTASDSSPTIAEYLQKTDKMAGTAYEGQPSFTVQSTKKTVINDLDCIQRREFLNAAGFTQTSTYFKKGSLIVVISFRPTSGNNSSADENLYDQLLSTFKFIPARSDSIAKFCGGFAGIRCPMGLTCRLDNNQPDAGGKCVKNPAAYP
jgi:hypothetical protein